MSSRNISSIKIKDDDAIEIKWTIPGALQDDAITFTSHDAPAGNFFTAFTAAGASALNLIHRENMFIRCVDRQETQHGIKERFTFADILMADHEAVYRTPWITNYLKGVQVTLDPDTINAVEDLISEAHAFIEGDRAQAMLPFEAGEEGTE